MSGLLVAREEGARLDDALAGVLAAEPYLLYANFPPVAAGLLPLHRRRWQAAAGGLGVLVCRDAQDRPLALLRLDRRTFESDHFGMPMAKIDLPAGVADDAVRLDALRALYAAARVTLRDAGVRHVSAVASTQDRAACWALQEAGLFHVGTRITWMAPLDGVARDTGLPAHLGIESYDRATIPGIDPSSWRRLDEWSATAFDRGPFVFDLNVPKDRAAALYRVWVRKAMTGEWAESLLVIRDGEEIVAFHAMLLVPDLSVAAGVGVLGRGIGAALPGYPGSFTALQRTCAATRPLGAGYLENETQAATIPSIKVFGSLGYPCLHTLASFHGLVGV